MPSDEVANVLPSSSRRNTDLRSELGIPAGAPVVGAVANLRPVKRLDRLIRAAARIAERTDARARALKAAFKGFKKPKGPYDDLKRIKGVDEQLAKKLASINVLKFEQIANFSDDEIAQIDETLKLKGRIERDDWAGQAAKLVAEATADEVPAGEEAEAAEKQD